MTTVSYVRTDRDVRGDRLHRDTLERLHRLLLARRDEMRVQLWTAPGCPACGKSGYKGRTGVHELLVSDDDMRRAIQRSAPVDEIRATAIAGGMTTLLQDGIEKVLDGATDLKQVLAVCGR